MKQVVIPEAIETDIVKLRDTIEKNQASIDNYKKVIERELLEKEKLLALLENPGSFNVESLKRNIDNCDKNVAAFEDTIRKEKENKKKYLMIIGKLQEILQRHQQKGD